MKSFDLNQPVLNQGSSDSGFNIEKLFLLLKRVWYWIPISVILFLGVAYYYLKYTKPVYQAQSLIKLEIQKEASELGLPSFTSKQNEDLLGEVELIRSPLVANDVLSLLDLNVSYFAIGELITTEIYKSSPFEIVLFSDPNTVLYDQLFYITFTSPYEFKLANREKDIAYSKTYRIGETIQFQGFKFAIKTVENKGMMLDQMTYCFKINSKGSLSNFLLSNVGVEIANSDARTIVISFKDNNRKKAIDIVDAYNQAYLKQSTQKEQKSQEQTLAYIDNQISETSNKLEEYEKGIENFMKLHGTTSPLSEYAEISTGVNELQKIKEEVDKTSSSIDKIQAFIQRDESKDNVIPMIIGIENNQIAQSLDELNGLYKQRELLKFSNKEVSMAYRKIELEISLLKSRLLSYVQETKKFINEQKAEINSKIGEFKNQYSSLPNKETELNRLKRFNALYEKFYLSLIEKQIEYQISKAGTVPEFTILSNAYADENPISPNKQKIYLGFIIISFLPTVLFILYQYLFNNVIFSRKNLEKKLLAPILGIVPSYNDKMPASTIVVDKNPKSAISESLRSIRTNSEFMLTKKQHQIYGVTSTVSGEGKTFFAINYAAILAMSGKKVIVLDLDMRKPKIHIGFNVPNNLGISSVLSGSEDYKETIKQSTVKNLDFITAGPIPPNPNELLLKKEFDILVDSLFEDYDVIMADNPPIGLVSDANVVFRRCDLSIYVVRAGYTKESVVDGINQLYQKRIYDNFSVVMNDVNNSNTYGQYGYGNSYGYGYYQDDKVSSKTVFWKKWFKKN
jgi:capsular exopolysaccharide synthesis family protein